MTRVTPPPQASLPSPRRLAIAAIIAVVTAGVLAVVVVLPAERGIDLTGLGRLIGLTEMGEIKMEIAAERAADSASAAAARRADSVVIVQVRRAPPHPAHWSHVALAGTAGAGATSPALRVSSPLSLHAALRASPVRDDTHAPRLTRIHADAHRNPADAVQRRTPRSQPRALRRGESRAVRQV